MLIFASQRKRKANSWLHMEITFPTPVAEVQANSVPWTAWNSSTDAAWFLKTVLKHIYTEKILGILELLSQGSSGPTLKTTQLCSQLEFEVHSSSYIAAASGNCTELVLRSKTEKAVCWVRQILITFHKSESISRFMDLIGSIGRRR